MGKIVHIITGLNSGGAENMLYKLLSYSDKSKYHHKVISLMDAGIYGPKIESLGIEVHSLNFKKENVISSLIKVRNIAKDADIINTWLYHSDLIGFLIGKILLRKKLIWNIRHSNLDKDANKSRTLKIVKLNAFLSKSVDLITYNSNKALETHKKAGYNNSNQVVIPNGFDLSNFKFDSQKRIEIRRKLKLEDERVIITVGRWDIQKDYYTLLKALDQLNRENHSFKMLMVGTNLDESNRELSNLIKKHKLKEKVILLGRQNDIPGLLSAADVYVSSSLGESFSNSIGEAMACELPLVVTDVGDSKLMVGNTGKVVPARDPNSLEDALAKCLSIAELERNKKARKKILNNYDINKITDVFEKIWQDDK